MNPQHQPHRRQTARPTTMLWSRAVRMSRAARRLRPRAALHCPRLPKCPAYYYNLSVRLLPTLARPTPSYTTTILPLHCQTHTAACVLENKENEHYLDPCHRPARPSTGIPHACAQARSGVLVKSYPSLRASGKNHKHIPLLPPPAGLPHALATSGVSV